MESKYFIIKETKCILKYIGETCVDYHKGDYEDEYRVLYSYGRYKVGDSVCEYELRDPNDFRTYYTLVRLPNNVDLNNLKAIEVLYGG